MDFGLFPPEVNSALIYAGPGSGPMLVAAAAWDALAGELESTAASYGSEVSALTGGSWRGPSSAAMATAAMPFVTWMTATAGQAEQAATQAKLAAAAYESAFAMTVPPPVIAANRAQLMALVATNFFGQNTPAIAATEAHYTAMWAQDAAAMYGYAGASAAASKVTPFTPPGHVANPAGQAGVAANALGTAAGNHAQTAMSSVPQALQGLAAPAGVSQTVGAAGAGAMSSAASAPASALSTLGLTSSQGLFGGAGQSLLKSTGKGMAAASTLAAAPGLAGALNPGTAMDALGLGMDAVGFAGLDGGGVGLDVLGLGVDFLGAGSLFETEEVAGLGPLAGLGAGLGSVGSMSATATMSQVSSVSGLSVPPGWTTAAPISPAATLLSSHSVGAAPAVPAGGSGMPRVSFGDVAGRGVGSVYGQHLTVLSHSPVAG